MTRNIRKIVSILCAVSVLLSLCTVSFLGSSSAAAPAEDTATTVVWDNVALNLTFDGANNGGIAMSNASTREIKDGAFYLSNVGGSQGSAWIGKDATVNAGATIPNKTNVGNAAQSPKANLFALKGNTNYKITFKYAFRNDTPEGKALQFMAANDPYLFQNHGRANTLADNYVASTQDAMDAKAGAPAGDTGYGELKEETYIFTTNANAEGKFLGFRTSSSNMYVKVDDFKIEIGSNALGDLEYDYNFDFKNGDTPYVALDIVKALGNSTKHFTIVNVDGSKDAAHPSFIDAEGYHIGSFTANAVPGPTDTDNKWMNNAVIYDTDAVEGGVLKFKADASYIVRVKYKIADLGNNTSATLAVTANLSKNGNACIGLGSVTVSEAFDEWRYLEVSFSTKDIPTAVGRWLYLGVSSSSSKWADYVIESVSVKEKRDVTNGVAIIETVNGAETTSVFAQAGAVYNLQIPEDTADKGFAGWFTTPDFKEGTKVDITNYIPAKGKNTLYARWANTISEVVMNNCGVEETVKIAVGEKLPRPIAPNGNLFFEGWYTDLSYTTKVTEVPDYDVTLYAKYNGIYLGFENISHVAGETTGDPQLVADPNNADNKVVKFVSDPNSRPNFMLPAYDMAGVGGFELKTNTTYTMSFKARLVSADGVAAGYQFYRGDHSSQGNTTTRTAVSGAAGSISSDQWLTYTATFTTGASHYLERVKWSYQNHFFFTMYSQKDTLEVYIDDFCIVEKLTSAPEGATTIKFETNSETSEMYGYPNDPLNITFVPNLGGYEFVGWYADKNLTVPFTATKFPAEDTTIYAKWKPAPFLVDFTGYAKGTASARAKFVKDDKGNDYVDWHVDHADSNTSDTGTAYRIFLNKNGVHYTVSQGAEYTIKFKYKLLSASVNKVTIKAVTNGKLNGWADYKEQAGGITISAVTEDWKEASFSFVAAPLADAPDGIYLSLGVADHGHILIDDIVVETTAATANLYGATKLFFNTNGGAAVDPMSGDPGEAIGTLPAATKPGYTFNGWFADAELTTPFTGTTYGEEDITVYADWLLGKFAESYEDYPQALKAQGLSGAYDLYNEASADDFDKSNVQSGKTSLYRKGETTGTKGFTLCRSTDLKLTVGKQYTLTFYVKPVDLAVPTGTINLIGMKTNIGHVTPTSTNVITTMGDLKVGQWQKVTYTFTADANYVGISTTQGNNMYLDNFVVTLSGYTGTTTGDDSINPIFIVLMVLLAAGSLVITGKKVFEK